jgi:uncharacterized protein (DUF983 family)
MKLAALITGRCPRCHQGRIFKPFFAGRVFAMNDRCSVCGLRFEREAGYFIGAMYFSYTLGVLTVLPVAVVLAVVYELPVAIVLFVAVAQTLISIPIFYRYSRIFWLHVDQIVDPR